MCKSATTANCPYHIKVLEYCKNKKTLANETFALLNKALCIVVCQCFVRKRKPTRQNR